LEDEGQGGEGEREEGEEEEQLRGEGVGRGGWRRWGGAEQGLKVVLVVVGHVERVRVLPRATLNFKRKFEVMKVKKM
jgi:hypothetical protein